MENVFLGLSAALLSKAEEDEAGGLWAKGEIAYTFTATA